MDADERVAALTEDELDRLEELLCVPAFNGEAMGVDELQGLFCAVQSSPEDIAAARWLRAALGENPDYEAMDDPEELMGLLARLHAQVGATLASDRRLELFLYSAADDESLDFESWCRGYFEGMVLSTFDWRDKMGEQVFEDLLRPVMVLSGVARMEAEEEGEPWVAGDDERELLASCREELPHAVKRTWRYWKAPTPSVASASVLRRKLH